MSDLEKTILTWPDLLEMMVLDKNDRYTAIVGTPAAEYITENGYGYPTVKHPESHSKPLLTRKFIKWLIKYYPKTAGSYGFDVPDQVRWQDAV